MSRVEEYSIGCMMGVKDSVELLHIEVSSLRFAYERYSKHFRYEELPASIQLIFRNLAQVFIYLERKEMIYFDEHENALKICLHIAGEIKEFPIPLQPHDPSNVIKQKIMAYQSEKAKIIHEFNMAKIEKVEKLQAVKTELEALKAQRSMTERQTEAINAKTSQFQAQIQLMKRQCEQKMALIRDLTTKQSQLKINDLTKEQIPASTLRQVKEVSQNDTIGNNSLRRRPGPIESQMLLHSGFDEYKQHEERKKYWVEEIGKLRKEKFQGLKKFINERVDFEKQTTLSINHLRLAKMTFVEIFLNLTLLDLSNNSIAEIQGLERLRQLARLKLAQNQIAAIGPLPKLQRLVELTLCSNRIRKIENVFHLSNLQILNLNHNKIEHVPDDISRMSRLVEIRLFHNQISTIGEKVVLLKHLKVFSVVKNKCYNQGTRAREIINQMAKSGISTAIQEVEQINIVE